MFGNPTVPAPESTADALPVPSGGRRDLLIILIVWVVYAGLSLFVAPNYGDSTSELIYYSVYDVALGALVGFYLLDRASRDGLARFAIGAAFTILIGALINEAVVGPVFFGADSITGESVYHAVGDSLSTCAVFVLLRLAQRLAARTGSRPAGELNPGQFAPAAADADWMFVRASGGTRRIHVPDVLYMEAERDFTRIICVNGEHFVSESLKSLLDRSAKLGLVRVHKSFAVNLGHVDRLTRTELQLGARRVPVGRRYWPAFAETWRTRSVPLAAH